jgi:hypothetical protein
MIPLQAIYGSRVGFLSRRNCVRSNIFLLVILYSWKRTVPGFGKESPVFLDLCDFLSDIKRSAPCPRSRFIEEYFNDL